MARWYAPVVAFVALVALLGLMQWAAAPTWAANPADEPMPTELPTPTLTPTPTATPVFVVNLYVTPSLTVAVPGSTISVTLGVAVGPGCSYPILEHTLSQSPVLFEYVDPPQPTVRVGGSFSGSYLLRAVTTGTVTFVWTTYGERYCGDFWAWNYEQGVSQAVNVTTAAPRQYFSRVCNGGCRQ